MLWIVQSGMDDSTFSELFNYVAYPQFVRHFGTEDHAAWSLEKCPVRVDLVRPKTGQRYYTASLTISKKAVPARLATAA
jgi:hypothetical protein